MAGVIVLVAGTGLAMKLLGSSNSPAKPTASKKALPTTNKVAPKPKATEVKSSGRPAGGKPSTASPAARPTQSGTTEDLIKFLQAEGPKIDRIQDRGPRSGGDSTETELTWKTCNGYPDDSVTVHRFHNRQATVFLPGGSGGDLSSFNWGQFGFFGPRKRLRHIEYLLAPEKRSDFSPEELAIFEVWRSGGQILFKAPFYGHPLALSLSAANLNDDLLTEIARFDDLERLNLSNTSLTDSGLAKLKPLRSLQHIIVGGTQVTDQGVADYKAALPRVTIHRHTTEGFSP